MLNNELSLANIETVRDYDPLVQLVVTDRNQLIQVVLNLVKNAIDSMSGGGVLTVQTSHQDQRVRFSVQDTGCGMPPEQLEKVFTPFFTTKDPGKGTGLGLSVSFNIVESFGGNIFVNSVPDRGSVFSIELPYSFQAGSTSHPSPRPSRTPTNAATSTDR